MVLIRRWASCLYHKKQTESNTLIKNWDWREGHRFKCNVWENAEAPEANKHFTRTHIGIFMTPHRYRIEGSQPGLRTEVPAVEGKRERRERERERERGQRRKREAETPHKMRWLPS